MAMREMAFCFAFCGLTGSKSLVRVWFERWP